MRKWCFVVASAAALLVLGDARADGDACASLTRENVERCALVASPGLRAEGQAVRAAEAARMAASPLLPSNPVVALTGGRRSRGDERTTNWSASLAQEIEIGGQRGLRRDAATADLDAQRARAVTTGLDVRAEAWTAYFEALAADEGRTLRERLAASADALAIAARARADRGLVAPVEADLADAAARRAHLGAIAATRESLVWRRTLSALVGADPAADVAVTGSLDPLDPPADRDATPPEVAALEAERRSQTLRGSLLRRARVPNPTLSVFVENDAFQERVVGVGVSLPIPLPGNVGRTNLGEIAQADAFAARATELRDRAQRSARLRATLARDALASRRQEVDAIPADLAARTEQTIRDLGDEVAAGRLGVRDAVLSQQGLIELLVARLEARRALCLASVELARSLGWPDRTTP